MFDPLALYNPSPFADMESSTSGPSSAAPVPSPAADGGLPPWPTTPHDPDAPLPHLGHGQSRFGVGEGPSSGQGPYGREPKIYGLPEPGLIEPPSSGTAAGSNGVGMTVPEPFIRIRLTTLDRNRRDILIKFDAQTNLPNFSSTSYRNVSRSYGEFQQFYEALLGNNPQTIIPALPLAQTSAPTDEEDDRLVKIMLQRWVGRVCEDPILIGDEDVRSFVESDFGYTPSSGFGGSGANGKGRRRGKGSGFVGGLLGSRGVPDEDEELQKARFELTKLEGQFFETAKAVDRLAIARKALGSAHAEMGNRLVGIAATETHPPLNNALRKLGRTWHSLADLDHAQAISECVVLGDSLGYQGMNARSAKETLLMRTGVLEEYQSAVKTTISKRRAIERLKASSNIRPERVDEALEEMNEAERYEQTLARRADGISQNLHRALVMHNRYANDDITTALIEHARSSIMYERQLLKELEALRGDVANAANRVVVPSGPPKPVFVPVLEDEPRERLPSAPVGEGFQQPQPQGSRRGTPGIGPVPHTAGVVPPGGGNFVPHSIQGGPLHAPLPKTPLSPQQPAGPGPASAPVSPSPGSAVPPSTLAASFGPSSTPGPTEEQRASPVPPLGGRFADGTKSMFVGRSTPVQRPSPLAASASASRVAGVGQDSGSKDPLSGGASFGPLGPLGGPLGGPSGGQGHGQGQGGFGGQGQVQVDPLSGLKPHQMTSSLRVQTRPRLDAREAASKLANMF